MGYPINRSYPAHPDNYTKGRHGYDPEFIVVHYTAGPGTARDNAEYFSRPNGESSAHAFIDGGPYIYESVPDWHASWSVGNKRMNWRTLNLEICSDGEDFTPDEIDQASWWVQSKMRTYGIPARKVIRHHDAYDYGNPNEYWLDPHKACPAPYIDDAKWNKLHAQLTSGNVIGLKYSRIAVDGMIGMESVGALQAIFDIKRSNVIYGQPLGWRRLHWNITDDAVRYTSDPDLMSGSELIFHMQRLTGYQYRNGYLSEGFIKEWQGFVSHEIAQDGIFGIGTATKTQLWINAMLEKYEIKL